jgi:hypothetical protein
MKKTIKRRVKKIKIKPTYHESRHSFLFWLVVPLVLVWLSVGYLMGILGDKPIWRNENNIEKVTNTVVPYFQERGSFFENLDQPFISFWFDDAWLSQYTVSFPILLKNNFPAAIAVPVDAVETPEYMNWAQLQTVQKNGWEITNHSLEHNCQMHNWDKDRIDFEYRNSKYILWKNNLTADIFVTPCGVDSQIMRDEAAKIFQAYRTVDPGYNDPKNINFYNLKVRNIDDKTTLEEVKSWIDYAKENKLWVILVFHKIGENNSNSEMDDYSTSKSDLEQIVNYVKKSGVKVVVPRQILVSQNQT